MANNDVPDFDENGLLPEGVWKSTEPEFERRFVSDFRESPTRRKIFDGFIRLRAEIACLSLQGWHWVNGSYVTTKSAPEDVDVVTFADADHLDTLSEDEQTLILEFLYGRTQTKTFYDCDTYLVPVRQADDPLFDKYVTDRQDFADLYGRTNVKKTGIDLPKGFIELAILTEGDSAMSVTGTENPPKLDSGTNRSEVEWSASFLEEHLSKRQNLLQSLENSGDTRFSTRLQIESIKKEEALLRRRIAAARMLESDADVELVIDGNPVHEHRVDAKFFSRLLVYLQDVVEDLTVGNAPSRLELLSFAPSSFKTSFVLTGQTTEQLEIDLTPDEISGADILSNILDGAADNAVITSILDSAHVKRSYAKMMKWIGDSGATVNFRTRQNAFGAQISSVEARQRSDWMSELTVKTETFPLVGELLTGSLRPGRFEIQGGDGTVVSGRTNKEVARQIRGLRLGSIVRAEVKKTTKTHIDLDGPAISYSLKSITDASRPALAV